MTDTPAGHTFDLLGRCTCGRRESDLYGVTRADIGQPNIAHVGNLTETEYLQIEKFLEDRREKAWRATMDVGGSL